MTAQWRWGPSGESIPTSSGDYVTFASFEEPRGSTRRLPHADTGHENGSTSPATTTRLETKKTATSHSFDPLASHNGGGGSLRRASARCWCTRGQNFLSFACGRLQRAFSTATLGGRRCARLCAGSAVAEAMALLRRNCEKVPVASALRTSIRFIGRPDFRRGSRSAGGGRARGRAGRSPRSLS
jgi:hypothetical protein